MSTNEHPAEPFTRTSMAIAMATVVISSFRWNAIVESGPRLAEGTVKNHVTSILTKLDVSDRTQAALHTRELGIH